MPTDELVEQRIHKLRLEAAQMEQRTARIRLECAIAERDEARKTLEAAALIRNIMLAREGIDPKGN